MLDESDFIEAILKMKKKRKADKQKNDPDPDQMNSLLSDSPEDLKADSDCIDKDGNDKLLEDGDEHEGNNSVDEDLKKKISMEVFSEADEYQLSRIKDDEEGCEDLQEEDCMETEQEYDGFDAGEDVNIKKTFKVRNGKHEFSNIKVEEEDCKELKEVSMETEQKYDCFDDEKDDKEKDYINTKKTKKRKASQEKKDYRSGHCDQCNTFFKNISSHKANMHTNENTKDFCQFCGLYFAELKEHQARKHWKGLEENTGTPVTTFSCNICNSSIVWRTQRDLDRHVRRFHGTKATEGSHVCHCGLRFESFRILRVHQSYAHSVGMKPEKTKDGRYPCQQCDATFQYPNLLREHTQRVHEHIRFPCGECDKTFSDAKGRDQHKLLHHTEPQLQCHECGNKYHLERELERHKKVHTKEIRGDLICELCDKEFKNFKSLWNHQSAQCGKKYRKKYKKTGPTDSETLTCDTCGKGFKTSGALEKHINIIHKGERNFACDTCGKSFTRASNLFSHQKIHDSIKEFNCMSCNSAYGEKRNLMNHIKRNHPEEDLKYRRVTPQGDIIMDVKTSLYDLS